MEQSLASLKVRSGATIHFVTTPKNYAAIRPPSVELREVQRVPVVNRGFDTLIEQGLTIEETAALRSTFSSQVREMMVRVYCQNDPCLLSST